MSEEVARTHLLDKVARADVDEDVLGVLYPPRDVERARQRDEDLLLCAAGEMRRVSDRGEGEGEEERREEGAPLLAGLMDSSESMQPANLLCACLRSPNACVRCLSSCESGDDEEEGQG